MKYLYFLIIILLGGCNNSSQKKSSASLSENELANYSFLLNGFHLKGINNYGTGFIIKYKEQDFLVTNYHVLTGRDPYSNKITSNVKDTNTSVYVIFRSKGDRYIFHPMEYSLYNSRGEANFSFYENRRLNGQLMDISVMPILIPDEALRYTINEENMDLSIKNEDGNSIVIFGFPKGQFTTEWKAYKFNAKSISNNWLAGISSPYNLFFDSTTIEGMSGSPIYSSPPNSGLKLYAICFGNLDPAVYSRTGGGATFIKCAYDLIKSSYGLKSPVTGTFRQGK